MKKSLKVIASTAMVFSMFASVAMADTTTPTATTSTTSATTTTTTTTTTTAAVKTTADFKDLASLDAATKVKIDAMLAKGVFEGVAADSFGIEQNMTRAQFAKVLVLIYGVKVDSTITTSSFDDVKTDDKANSWAIPYIEAAKKAGLIDGMTNTTFAPGDNVTIGQFATALVKGLNKTVDQSGATWYADAVKQAIDLKILPADADGSKNATRADLVVGAFGGQKAFEDANQPAKVSVTEAKATGVHTVTVKFNKPVDTDKAKLALTKGTLAVVTTVKYADDKKSATFTLTDTKLSKGDYTVTLSGIDAANLGEATAKFTAEDETLQKIDFLTASDTIAFADKVVVKAKPTNQYGEAASINAGSYNVYTSGAQFVKINRTDDGNLLVTLDTDVTNGTTQGVSVIPVTIVNNDNHVTATKNFKLGTAPILSKLEIGNARYSVGTVLGGKGENVKFYLDYYDQYGGNIPFDALQAQDTKNNSYTNLIWNTYINPTDVDYGVADDGNNVPELKVSLINNIDKSGDFSFTVFDQAATATGKITIQSAKVATKVQVGDLNDVIAAGDVDAYVPVVAYDAQGNQLSTNDLASDENVSRIKVSVSGASDWNHSNNDFKIENSGEHIGSIKLTDINGNVNGAVSVTLVVATANATSTATKTYTISPARVPDKFKEVTAPAKMAVPGGTSKFEYDVWDQYGKKLDLFQMVDSNGNISLAGATYQVSVTSVTYNTATKVVEPNATANAYVISNKTGVKLSDGVNPYTGAQAKLFNNKFKFVTLPAATNEEVTFVAEIIKTPNGGTPTSIAKLTKKLTVAKSTEDLTYSVSAVPDLYYVLDSGIVSGSVYGTGAVVATGTNPPSDTNYLSVDEQENPTTSYLAKEVTISAKNAAGDTVKLPNKITQIRSSNDNVAKVKLNASGQAFVIGNKIGTATLNVSFTTIKGETKQATVPVTVKNDAISVATLTGDTDDTTANVNDSAFTVLNLDVYDNYGKEYDTNATVAKYNYLLGITFSVNHISTNGAASVNQYGEISGTSTTTFDLTATSPNGKSVTRKVTLN